MKLSHIITIILIAYIAIAVDFVLADEDANTQIPAQSGASNIPQTNDRLSPGDILYISLPGEEQLNKNFQIDKMGRLLLPEVGPIEVVNLDVPSLETNLKHRFSNYYRDVSRFSVVLKEKRLLITVLGFVKTPGLTDLPGEASIQMAINQSGGLVPGAQLNKVQLHRDGNIETVDYKYYLDSGDVGSLPNLESLDVIFVPSSPLIGNVQAEFDAATLVSGGDAGAEESAVKVFGEVRNPGSFTFKDESTVVDMILRAGGATRFGNVEHIRVINGEESHLFNLKAFFDLGKMSDQPVLNPGSIIFVPKDSEEMKSGGRTVYIMGQVPKPGAYESTVDATLIDILGNAGGTTRFADPAKIKIIRASGAISNFNLNEFLSAPNSLTELPLINPGDAIYIPELPKDPANNKSLWVHLPIKNSIYLLGEVNAPGRYKFDSNFGFLDVLSAASGPSTNADLRNIKITHRTGSKINVTKLNLTEYFNTGDENLLPSISAEDVIYIPSLNRDWLNDRKEDTVRVIGAVGKPGRYRFELDMTLLDLIANAGGTNSDAYMEKIIVVSKTCCSSRSTTFDLTKFAKTADYSLIPLLKPGDTVYIPNISESHWRTFMSSVKDIVSILTIVILLGVL